MLFPCRTRCLLVPLEHPPADLPALLRGELPPLAPAVAAFPSLTHFSPSPPVTAARARQSRTRGGGNTQEHWEHRRRVARGRREIEKDTPHRHLLDAKRNPFYRNLVPHCITARFQGPRSGRYVAPGRSERAPVSFFDSRPSLSDPRAVRKCFRMFRHVQ